MNCNVTNVLVDVIRLDRKLKIIENSMSMNLYLKDDVVLTKELFTSLREDLLSIRDEIQNFECDE